MKTNDLAVLGYASQMLAFAMLSALFLARRTSNPFSGYLGVASAASCLLGGVLAGYAAGYISFGAIVVFAEWARHLLWIGALLMVLRTLDAQRIAEKVGRRYVLPISLIALASLVLYSSRKFDSFAISLVISGGILFLNRSTEISLPIVRQVCDMFVWRYLWPARTTFYFSFAPFQ
jgi:hypothetical protein